MTHATLRLPRWERALYVHVLRLQGEYARVRVTCYGRPGWKKGSEHLVPAKRLTERRPGAHRRRRWWQF